jgi:hypothetical protein
MPIKPKMLALVVLAIVLAILVIRMRSAFGW